MRIGYQDAQGNDFVALAFCGRLGGEDGDVDLVYIDREVSGNLNLDFGTKEACGFAGGGIPQDIKDQLLLNTIFVVVPVICKTPLIFWTLR